MPRCQPPVVRSKDELVAVSREAVIDPEITLSTTRILGNIPDGTQPIVAAALAELGSPANTEGL